MKRIAIYFLLMATVMCLSFGIHKFYTAIYQLEFVPKKQMLQVTARIFNDDLNAALENKFHTRIFLGTDKETPDDLVYLKKYLNEKFILKINGQNRPLQFHSKEVEDNVVICYLSCKEVTKINTLGVENTILIEIHPEQQNIIQANFNGKKSSLLLNSQTFKGMLK